MIWIPAYPTITYLVTGSKGNLSTLCFPVFSFSARKKYISQSVQKKPPNGPITKLAAVVFIHITCKTLLFVTVRADGNENNNNKKTPKHTICLYRCIFWYLMTKLYQRQAWWTACVWWTHPFCTNPTHSSKHCTRTLPFLVCSRFTAARPAFLECFLLPELGQNKHLSFEKLHRVKKKTPERILSLIGSFVLSLEMMW